MASTENDTKGSTLHDRPTPVASIEGLEELLVVGLESGEPRPMTDDDWDALRRRAMLDTELRRST
jgi:hypothetical protein